MTEDVFCSYPSEFSANPPSSKYWRANTQAIVEALFNSLRSGSISEIDLTQKKVLLNNAYCAISSGKYPPKLLRSAESST